MKDYRKDTKLSDDTIASFRTVEINKIKEKTRLKTPRRRHFNAIHISAGVIAILVLSLVIAGLFGNDAVTPDDTVINDDLTIQELNTHHYLIETEFNEKNVYFYYKAYVAYHSDMQSFNALFDYKQPYTLASDTVASTIDITLEGFQLKESRLFLENTVEGTSYYTQIDIYKAYSYDVTLTGLNITDFEADIKDIYELIDLYPPVVDGEDFNGFPTYKANPLITELDNQRRIDNYEHYVNNYYRNEDDYTEISDGDAETYIKNSIVILDDANNYLTTTFSSYSYDRFVAYEETPNPVQDAFRIYRSGEQQTAFSTMSKDFDHYIESVDGELRVFKDGFDMYAYLLINEATSSIDLSQVDYIKLTYTLAFSIDPDQTEYITDVPSIRYNDLLIIEPIYLGEHNEDYLVSGFRDIVVSLYDDEDTLIETIQLNTQIQD